jgi:hypothetical protein
MVVGKGLEGWIDIILWNGMNKKIPVNNIV